MLNIDYSTPRRFLMSGGLAFIFIGFLVIFGILIFATERFEYMTLAQERLNLMENQEDMIELEDSYESFYDSMAPLGEKLVFGSGILIITGVFMFFIGLLIWVFQGIDKLLNY